MGVNPWHLCVYSLTEAASQVNTDMNAVPDPIFSQRNNHYLFSEPYWLAFARAASLHATDARSNIPYFNNVGRHHIYPVEVSANEGRATNYPRVQDFRAMPLPLPVTEELAFEASTNSSGATTSTFTLGFTVTPSPNLDFSVPAGNPRMVLKGSATVSSSAIKWSGATALTMAENQRGGWYAVNAAYCVAQSTGAPAHWFRLIFPRAPQVNGRQLRPGSYVSDIPGNMEAPYINNGMGEWGRFHTVEPPQIELWATAALSAAGFNVFLDVSYLGTAPNYTAPGMNLLTPAM